MMKQMKKWIMMMLMAISLSFMMSCSSEDGSSNDVKQDNASNNKTDVAVTGNVVEVGVTYVSIDGYVNLSQITSSYTNSRLGVELSLDEDFKKANNYYTEDLEGNKINVVVGGLDGETKYYYRTCVKINNLNYYGEKHTFTTKSFSNVTTTGEVTDLNFTSATINCKAEINSLDSKNYYDIGLVYSKTKSCLNPDSLYLNTSKVTVLGHYINNIKENAFTANLSKLETGTTYYYCSFTRAGSRYKLSDVKSFTTKSVTDSNLETGGASDITFTSAVIKSYSDIGSYYKDQSISYGVSYSTSKQSLENKDYNCYFVNASINDNYFTANINNLQQGVTYYYYAYVTVSDITFTGKIKNFTTKSGSDYLKTFDATEITHNSAILNGYSDLSSLYPNTTITYKMRYSTTSSNLSSDNKSIIAPLSVNGKNIVATLSKLESQTTYYFCLVANVGNLEITGEIKQFTTHAYNYKGNGTETSPFNVADAIVKCKEIGNKISNEKYYIKGITTAEYTVDRYHNATFDLVDTEESTEIFHVDRIMYKDGNGLKEGYRIPKGAIVIIYGSLINYNGKTPQTSTDAYLVSVNGKAPDIIEIARNLTNGDFETWVDGLPIGWKSASTASSATLTQSTDAHGGSYSVNVNGDEGSNKRLASQEITLAAGTYFFPFYAKATTTNISQVRPGYVPVNDGKVGNFAYGEYTNLNTGWTKITHEFTLAAETTICLLVMNPRKSNYSSGKDVLIDDATLTKR